MPTTTPPDVPGFVVTSSPDETPTDRHGLVRLRAVEEESRRRVTLVLLPALSPAERQRVSDVLARFAEVSHEHLGPPTRLADRTDALVVDVGEYVTLDQLMPAARPESAGQVVTVLAPVAEAVACLHDARLVHGDVGETTVSIDAEGRPTLVEAGVVAALHALAPQEVAEPTVEQDRDDVLALAQALAAPVDDASFTAVVDELVAQQPDPGRVAQVLLDEVEPRPLGGAGALGRDSGTIGDGAASAAGTGRGLSRRWLAVAAVGLVAILAGVGLWLGSRDSGGSVDEARTDPPIPSEPSAQATATPSPTPDASGSAEPTVDMAALGTELCGAPAPAPDEPPELADDWVTVIDELYTRRSAALVTGQSNLLCDVYDPLSPGLASDLELDAAYATQGVRPDSLVFVVEQATLLDQDGALLVLEITDSLEPYSLIGEDGRVVAELPGIGSETWQARLVPDSTGTQWRFG